MTPPFPKVGPAPADKDLDSGFLPGLKFDLPQKRQGKDIYFADAGKPKAGAAKAKTPPSKEDLKSLIPFLGDEQLFGVYNTEYQKDRNKKFLRLTLAVLAIRNYLKGEGDVTKAVERIADWRSEPGLIQDNANLHAGKNLVWVLDRVSGDPGVDEILKTIRADYSAEAAEKAKPKPKSREEIAASLSDDGVFGDQIETFKKEKTKKYLKVNLAVIEIKKFLSGNADALETAKTRIVEWLKVGALLTDPVALKARKNLIKLLSGPTKDEALGKNLKDVVDLLKADYSVEAKEEPAPKTEEKKPEEKKVDEKKPEEVKPADPKPEEPKAKATVVAFFKPPKVPGKRDDDFKRMLAKCNLIFRGTYERYLKSYADLRGTVTLNYKVDNKTGAVTEVRFTNIKMTGSAAPEAIEGMLRDIAGRMHEAITLEKQGSEPHSEIMMETLRFQPSN